MCQLTLLLLTPAMCVQGDVHRLRVLDLDNEGLFTCCECGWNCPSLDNLVNVHLPGAKHQSRFRWLAEQQSQATRQGVHSRSVVCGHGRAALPSCRGLVAAPCRRHCAVPLHAAAEESYASNSRPCTDGPAAVQAARLLRVATPSHSSWRACRLLRQTAGPTRDMHVRRHLWLSAVGPPAPSRWCFVALRSDDISDCAVELHSTMLSGP